MSALSGLRVLVTRPEAQSAALVAAIDAAGGSAIAEPMLRIESSDAFATAAADALRAFASAHNGVDVAIFISTNAVRHGMPVLAACADADLQRTRFVAIGSATAAALEQAGVAAAAAEKAMNSETLLAMPSLQSIDGRSVLVMQGEGGRGLIANALRERGAAVLECPVYRRLGPSVSAQALSARMQRAGVNVALLGSGEALTNLCGLLDAQCTGSMWMVVPGERVAAIADSLGCQHVLVAENATDAAMLQAVADARERIVRTTDQDQ